MASLIGNDQPYLVIFCHAYNVNVSDYGNPGALRQTQIDVFEELVNPAFDQMSFGRTDFDFSYTDWLSLPMRDEPTYNNDGSIKDKGYFDRSSGPAKMLNSPFVDALNVANTTGINPEDYGGFIICMATDHLRAWSSTYDAGMYWPNIMPFPVFPVVLYGAKHVIILSLNNHWGRRIHEISHGLGVGDFYGKDGVITSGSSWDIGGSHNRVPLYSGYSMDRMGWYESGNIRELEWSETDFEETFEIQAHGFVENNDADVTHLVRIKIFDGLIYYLEVRQGPDSVPSDLEKTGDALGELAPAVAAASNNPGQQLFDLHVPYTSPAPADKGGLLITKVIDKNTQETLNQAVRTVTVFSVGDSRRLLEVDDKVEDPARRISVEVVDTMQFRPLRLKVRVAWKEVATADPAGLFNLRMRPWDNRWQTPDIWVDSTANGIDVYQNPPDPITNDIPGNGDKPWVDNCNRFYAKFKNEGIVDAHDVQLTWYLNSPPAIGDRGTWIPIYSRIYGTVAAGDTISGYVKWFPEEGKHTCLKAAVSSQTGETAVGDNSAQENVFDFDTTSSSPHRPIVQTVSVQNPLPEPVLVYLSGRGLPQGWEATVEHGWLWLEPLGERQLRVAIFSDGSRNQPLAHYPEGHKRPAEVPVDVHFSLSGKIYRWLGEGPNKDGFAEHLLPIGGILINAHARKGAEIDIDLDERYGSRNQKQLVINGQIVPKSAAKLVLSIRDAAGEESFAWPDADAGGYFSHDVTAVLQSSTFPARITASIVNHSELADSTSQTLAIESIDEWYYQ